MAEIEFLVRGECSCGWFMAAAEGSRWPKCPECGEQVLPPRAPMPDGTAGPADDHHLVGGTLAPREGYIAIRLPERDAIGAVLATKYDGARKFDVAEDGKLMLRMPRV